MTTITDMVGGSKLTGLGIGATGVSTIATLATGTSGTAGMIIVGVLTLAQIVMQHLADVARIKAGLATKPGLVKAFKPSAIGVEVTEVAEPDSVTCDAGGPGA